jgi:hypothetical protein
MIKALANKAEQAVMSFVHSLMLLYTEDLSVHKDKLQNVNLQLTWVGQGMSDLHLVDFQLKKFYQKDDDTELKISNILLQVLLLKNIGMEAAVKEDSNILTSTTF